MFHRPIEIPVRRGVRQGDTISPKLFTAALEDMFRKLDWEEYGIKIDGEKLHHLRFADDIVLFAHDIGTAETMLEELEQESAQIGLKINQKKTKAMINPYCRPGQISINGAAINFVEKHIYLGQEINIEHKIDGEIRRRRSAAWTSFRKIEDVLKRTTDTKIRAQLFNTTILPALNYGAETWTMRKRERQQLAITQRTMERRILGIRLNDRNKNVDIRTTTKFKGATEDALQRKLRWAGHIARRSDNRWTTKATFWWPYDTKRTTGRPPDRWRKDLEQTIGKEWHQVAKNREKWKKKSSHLHHLLNQPHHPCDTPHTSR